MLLIPRRFSLIIMCLFHPGGLDMSLKSPQKLALLRNPTKNIVVSAHVEYCINYFFFWPQIFISDDHILLKVKLETLNYFCF